jgi:hypothetical protein
MTLNNEDRATLISINRILDYEFGVFILSLLSYPCLLLSTLPHHRLNTIANTVVEFHLESDESSNLPGMNLVEHLPVLLLRHPTLFPSVAGRYVFVRSHFDSHFLLHYYSFKPQKSHQVIE